MTETKDQTVYIGVYVSEYGTDVDLYVAEADAYHTLAQVALDNLDDIEDDDDPSPETVAVIHEMVTAYKEGDYRRVVELYNDNADECSLSVRAISLRNAVKPAGKLPDEKLESYLPTCRLCGESLKPGEALEQGENYGMVHKNCPDFGEEGSE